MGFFNNKKNIEVQVEDRGLESTGSMFLGSFRTGGYSSYTQAKSMKLATVNRCVNLISDSIASLPINPYKYNSIEGWKYVDYQSNLYNLLNVQPNAFTSAYMFKKLAVVNILTKGSAYILISRNKKGDVTALDLLVNDFVTLVQDKQDIKYRYSLTNATYDKSQIIHILNYTSDGITGLSVIAQASEVLGLAHQAEAHAKNFFSGAMSGILRPLAGTNIDGKKALAAKETISNLSAMSNGIIVLDSSLEYQKVNLNSKEMQLIESRQFSISQIASFFGVPPSLAFSETGKFSTAEQQQLDYLNNCLSPLIEKIESEMFRKLFLPSEWNLSDLKFDVENLLRLDAASKASYYSTLFNVGALTTNEIREKINANTPMKGGNRSFIQVNLQPLDNLISEQVQTTDPNNQIDNKLKA